MKVKVERYDAFSEVAGKGNPAGIILNGDVYTEEQMQTIARLVSYNECCFVCSSRVAELRLRYFTPGHETGLCGHATIGAIAAWIRNNAIEQDVTLAVETAVGSIEVCYRHATKEIMMQQANAKFLPFEGNIDKLLETIGLPRDAYMEGYPVCYGWTGSWTLLVPIKSLDYFLIMKPENKRFPEVLQQNERASVHPITFTCYDKKHTMHGRHFSSPFSGTVEDSVTGTASGVMGAYYLNYVKEAEEIDILIEQGNEIQKEGTVRVVAQRDSGEIAVKIFGRAVYNETFYIEI